MSGSLAKWLGKEEEPICNWLKFSSHITENVVTLGSTEFMTVIKVDGRTANTANYEDVERWVSDLNMCVRQCCDETIELYSYVIRRKATGFPGGKFNHRFAAEFNEAWASQFNNEDLYQNDLYLAIVYKPIVSSIVSVFAKIETISLAALGEFQTKAVTKLMDVTETFCTFLAPYRARVLGIYRDGKTNFSEVMEPFGYILNGFWSPVPVSKLRMRSVLPKVKLGFSNGGIIGVSSNFGKDEYLAMLELRDYCEESEPGHMNWLLESNFELVICNSFTAMSASAAEGALKEHQTDMKNTQDAATSQIQAIDNALDQLKSRHFVMGIHHATIMVRNADHQLLLEQMKGVAEELGRCEILCRPLERALEAGFWAQFPGNRALRPRPCPITSLNFLSFSSFHNYVVGKKDGNPWGDAITAFKTSAKSPFYFNFHETPLYKDNYQDRPLANTILLGKSGEGKTTLLCMILCQAMKANPTLWLYDKDLSMKIFVNALDGEYFTFRRGEPTGLNFFQLPATERNILFWKKMVKLCVGQDGQGVTPFEEQQINEAISAILDENIPKESRRISLLLQAIPDVLDGSGRVSLHSRLKKWCVGGDHGWLWDNESDRLSLGNSVFGFDVTDFLDEPEIRAPLMMYLNWRSEELIDGRPFIYGFEEYWKLAEDDDFNDLVKNKMKTIRKSNGFCIFSTQEPDDALESDIGRTLNSQMATVICLRNDKAEYSQYKKLNITEVEFGIIKDMPADSRKVVIRQGVNSAVVSTDLSKVAKFIKVFGGNPDRAVYVDHLMDKYGKESYKWLPELYRSRDNENKAS